MINSNEFFGLSCTDTILLLVYKARQRYAKDFGVVDKLDVDTIERKVTVNGEKVYSFEELMK